jgi:chemotaxis protein MotB
VFTQDKSNSENNFWISYADLMAGLLFVFILLIGAIISKSIILKKDLAETETSLSQQKIKLNQVNARLGDVNAILAQKQAMLSEKEAFLEKNIETLKLKDSEISKKDLFLEKNMQTIKLKDDEIKRLNQLLAQANSSQDALNKKILIVQNLLDTKSKNLAKSQKSLKSYEGKVLVLSNQVNDLNSSVKLKDEKVLELLSALDAKATKYDTLIADLRKQKAKIKALTGIRLKVIAALKEELGTNIAIDKKSGSLRVASNVLFDTGEATLKEENKAGLKKAFEEYVGTLVTNPKIKPHIDKIIIEGHTDSDGEYLYNLELSQKRALAVLNYITTLKFTQTHHIKPLLIASGRGYLDTIKVNGVEDKEASRRIEIKFTLKNDDAMQEIEKILDAK